MNPNQWSPLRKHLYPTVTSAATPDLAPSWVVDVIYVASVLTAVYASYARKAPSEFKIVGFAEPNSFRSERFACTYEIPMEKRFETWEDVFIVKKFADAVVITTPDALHYGPAMSALETGYDILLEKAIAQSWQQCTDIMNLAVKKSGGHTSYADRHVQTLELQRLGHIRPSSPIACRMRRHNTHPARLKSTNSRSHHLNELLCIPSVTLR